MGAPIGNREAMMTLRAVPHTNVGVISTSEPSQAGGKGVLTVTVRGDSELLSLKLELLAPTEVETAPAAALAPVGHGSRIRGSSRASGRRKEDRTIVETIICRVDEDTLTVSCTPHSGKHNACAHSKWPHAS